VREDIEVLVDEVETILLAIVAQNVLLFVRVAQLHDFAADEVADATSEVDESEAVGGDPETGLHRLGVLINELECLLETILAVLLIEHTLSDGLVNGSGVKLQQVDCVL